MELLKRSASNAVVVLLLAGCASGATATLRPSAPTIHPTPTIEPTPTLQPTTDIDPTPTLQTTTPGASTGPPAVEVTISTPPTSETLFVPDEASVPADALVMLTFHNASNAPHNLTLGDPIEAATEPVVEAGESDSFEFTAPAAGAYEWVCTLHPWMTGTLTVSDR